MSQTVDNTTVQRRWQSPFIKLTPTIQPYAFTGECSRLGAVSKPLGDVEYTECMDASAAGEFREDSEIESRPGPVTGQMIMKKSIVGRISAEVWEKCKWNVDIRLQFENTGARDSEINWNAIDRYLRTKFTSYDTDDETTYTRDEQGEVLMTMPFTGPPLQFFNLRRVDVDLIDSDKAGNINCVDQVSGETCPTVGGPAQGCILVAGTADIGGNPYFGKSLDGGSTWAWTAFDGANNTPTWTNPITGISGKGNLIVAVSAAEPAHAVSKDGGLTWTEIVSGDYAANAPQAVFVYSPTAIWICGANGYVWKSVDSGTTVDTSPGGDPGVATGSALVRIKALTDRFVVAVGAANAIISSTNGGKTWGVITGPAAQAAVQANTVCMWDENIWALGYEDGDVYWTDEANQSATPTWTEDVQITDEALTAVNDIAVHATERYILVGEDADGLAAMYENVNGAPGLWEEITSVPADVQELFQVAICNQNLWVAVGEVTYVGALGAIVQAVG